MAIHKSRSGALLVCYWCKEGECNESEVHRLDDIVCHCPCQPSCSERGCQPENVKTGRRKFKAGVCSRCYLTKPCDCS